jgi:salicylate hydroxylase
MGIAIGNLKPEKKHVVMEAMRMEEGLGAGERWLGHSDWGAPYFERTGAHRKDLLDLMTSLIDEIHTSQTTTFLPCKTTIPRMALLTLYV